MYHSSTQRQLPWQRSRAYRTPSQWSADSDAPRARWLACAAGAAAAVGSVGSGCCMVPRPPRRTYSCPRLERAACRAPRELVPRPPLAELQLFDAAAKGCFISAELSRVGGSSSSKASQNGRCPGRVPCCVGCVLAAVVLRSSRRSGRCEPELVWDRRRRKRKRRRVASTTRPGVLGVPHDPLAPRRGPLGSSPDRESAIGWVGNLETLQLH